MKCERPQLKRQKVGDSTKKISRETRYHLPIIEQTTNGWRYTKIGEMCTG